MPGKVVLDPSGRVKLDSSGKVVLSNASDECPSCCTTDAGCDIEAIRPLAPTGAACLVCLGHTPLDQFVGFTDVTACAEGCYLGPDPIPPAAATSVKLVYDLNNILAVSCYSRRSPNPTPPPDYFWSTDGDDPPGTACVWSIFDSTPEITRQYGTGVAANTDCDEAGPPGFADGYQGSTYGYEGILDLGYDSVADLYNMELTVTASGTLFHGFTTYTPDDPTTPCYVTGLNLSNTITTCDPGGYASSLGVLDTGMGTGGIAEVTSCCASMEGVKRPKTKARKVEPHIGAAKVAGSEKWGPALWREIHQRPMSLDWTPGRTDDLFLARITSKLPCGSCRGHWMNIKQLVRWDFSSRRKYFESTVRAHNLANKGLGKPEISLAEAAKLHGYHEPSRPRRRRSK